MDRFLAEAKAFASANEYPKEVWLAFLNHYLSAKRRGIVWEFTIKEWGGRWQTDNRWANRGRGHGKFVMARFNDQGPYGLTNTYCATAAQNHQDSVSTGKRSAAIRAWWAERHIDAARDSK